MKGAIIRISENAFQSMLLAALEAYFITHESGGKKERALETCGTLWGNVVSSGRGKIICVHMAAVETSAIRQHGYVIYKTDSIRLKLDMMRSLYPQYQFLGDFHTHAFSGAKVVEEQRLWRASEDDKQGVEAQSDWLRSIGYECGVIMTIARIGHTLPHPEHKIIEQSAGRLTFGNLRIWTSACYAAPSGGTLKYVDDKHTVLHMPGLEGMNYAYSAPGKVSRRGIYVPVES